MCRIFTADEAHSLLYIRRWGKCGGGGSGGQRCGMELSLENVEGDD